ncbi:hypothetical protein HERIO_994 [Hepatospora eriocheir]|uniref:Uncharacterized protein n=1 Tax=Hepatospora eriocheir TaxID=1081669 RepID=A0A1X0QBE3_9MICR|nr:hypothetical protein HERIO_994 [Hepatospora eriocheir]
MKSLIFLKTFLNIIHIKGTPEYLYVLKEQFTDSEIKISELYKLNKEFVSLYDFKFKSLHVCRNLNCSNKTNSNIESFINKNQINFDNYINEKTILEDFYLKKIECITDYYFPIFNEKSYLVFMFKTYKVSKYFMILYKYYLKLFNIINLYLQATRMSNNNQHHIMKIKHEVARKLMSLKVNYVISVEFYESLKPANKYCFM